MNVPQSVRGTRDFYPDELRLRNHIFSAWRQTSLLFGFEEYDACLLEHADLYAHKAGEEIADQLYQFQDKSNRHLALRPEMTPTLARLVLSKQKTLTFPLRWFSIPQCFRYERMTKGRRREHYQWNLDIWGVSGIEAEVEIVSAALFACETLGLTHQQISIFYNHRKLLDAILQSCDIQQKTRDAVMIVLDKIDKIPKETLCQELSQLGCQTQQIDKLLHLLGLQTFDELLQHVPNDSIAELQAFQKQMALLNFEKYLKFDLSIVRGLAYYTGLVFEMKYSDKSGRAICGGGRYDTLLEKYGGQATPAVGFGFGDVVIADVLQEHQLIPDLKIELDYLILPFSPNERSVASQIAMKLRRKGFKVKCTDASDKIKKGLKTANEQGIPQAILLFPDELEAGNLVLRNMQTGEQKNYPLADLSTLPHLKT